MEGGEWGVVWYRKRVTHFDTKQSSKFHKEEKSPEEDPNTQTVTKYANFNGRYRTCANLRCELLFQFKASKRQLNDDKLKCYTDPFTVYRMPGMSGGFFQTVSGSS